MCLERSPGLSLPLRPVPAMSLDAPYPQPRYMLSGRSCAPARRYAGTQAGASYERQVPRSARPINSICTKRLRILPDRLPCHFSLSLSIKGFSYHTRSPLAR
ncbi:hypothetical protein FJTKL_02523 [Diaporthe vaccinii]|uniref:Uncharacterized protein n=1 Tax=Diaporthe vaccinii TaxID=105482 RepID=A0ABR4DY17_9PEZI